MNMKPNMVAEELAQVIGFISTIRLCAVHGGRSLYIPGTAEPDHYLATLLQAEPFQALVDGYGSSTITVPKIEEFDRWSKVRQVSQYLSKGWTPNEISQALIITPRYVRMLRRDAESIGLLPMVLTSGQVKEPVDQPTIFDVFPAVDEKSESVGADVEGGGAPEGHPPARVRRAAPSS